MATYARLSFTNEEEKQLIAFLERHPILWDPTHIDYGNVRLRQTFWSKIAEQLNKSEYDCRRKWRFMRDYYVHKRQHMNGETLDKVDSKYQSLNFLHRIVSVRVNSFGDYSKRNIKNTLQPNTNSKLLNSQNTLMNVGMADSSEGDSSSLNKSNTGYRPQQKVSITSVPMDEEEDGEHKEQLNGTEQKEIYYENEPPRSIADTISIDNRLKQACSTDCQINGRDKFDKSLPDGMQQRAIDLFFESMATTVKTFPLHLLAQSKIRVFNVISELELQLHRDKF